MYESSTVVYYLALIGNFFITFKRYVCCMWFIEQVQVFVRNEYLYCTIANNLPICRNRYRIRYFIESHSKGNDNDGDDNRPQANKARRNFANYVPHFLASQFNIIKFFLFHIQEIISFPIPIGSLPDYSMPLAWLSVIRDCQPQPPFLGQ